MKRSATYCEDCEDCEDWRGLARIGENGKKWQEMAIIENNRVGRKGCWCRQCCPCPCSHASLLGSLGAWGAWGAWGGDLGSWRSELDPPVGLLTYTPCRAVRIVEDRP